MMGIPEFKSFETERLLIRPTSLEDATFILELMNTPKWFEYIGDRNIKTIGDAEEYIKTKMLPQLRKLGFANYTLIRKKDGMKVGTCGLYDREGMEGIDIGFAFLPKYEKLGLAFEAANRVKQAAFNEFGIYSLQAFTTKDNHASQRLLKKLGFVVTGTSVLPDETVELMKFSAEK